MGKRGLQTKGRSSSGITTKFHLALTDDGHLVEGFLTAGNVSDITVAGELTKNVFDCNVLDVIV